MTHLDIDDFSNILKKSLSDGYILMMYEAFLLRMESVGVNKPCSFYPHSQPNNILSDLVCLNWEKEISVKIKRSHSNQNQTTDFSSMLIVLGIVSGLDKIKKDCGISEFAFETSATGTGIDFWIAEESENLNFKARIEISGIAAASKTNNLKTREKKKKKQVAASDNTLLPVYIGLIEYKNREALIIENQNFE